MGSLICEPDGVCLVKDMGPAHPNNVDLVGTKFDRIDLGARRFAFQSKGSFLSAELDGRIVCDRAAPRNWETFWVYGSDVGFKQVPAIQSDTTVVVTSCGRHDLLERTIDSFLEFNTYPIAQYIIVEDSGDASLNDQLKRKYAGLPIIWIEEPRNRGQLVCIDDAYSRVRTKYIFHCEDDWEFYRAGFIEQSRAIMENSPAIVQVWIRAETDTNNHPVEEDVFCSTLKGGLVFYSRLAEGFHRVYHGFSWNPGLRRLCDYHLLGAYSPYINEINVTIAYHKLLFRAVIIRGPGFVRHIGGARHVRDPFAN
jgi:hypothetical protein